MRKLTFPTFIKYYLWDLSDSKTLNIHKLAEETTTNYRLLEPLVLYCLYFKKTHILKKYIDEKYISIVDEVNLENVFSDKYSNDYSFIKVRTSYQRRTEKYEYGKTIKSMIRENIKKEMDKKNLSIYFIYKSLHLNKGTVNAFISKGDVDKLSLETAKKIYNFVDNYS